MTPWHRIKPLKHRLIVRVSYLLPSNSPCSLTSVRTPPQPYLPWEIPDLLRKRLIAFLRGVYPVPPAQLEPLIPAGEAETARRSFRQMVKAGVSPGDALIELGIITKKEWSNVPKWSTAKILRGGCTCAGKRGTVGLVASSAGEFLDNEHRVVRCSEFAGEIEAAKAALRSA